MKHVTIRLRDPEQTLPLPSDTATGPGRTVARLHGTETMVVKYTAFVRKRVKAGDIDLVTEAPQRGPRPPHNTEASR